MPLLAIREEDAAERTANEMRRTAELLDALAHGKPSPGQRARARPHPEMEQIARRFAAINATLEKGVKAGSVTKAQLRSIGNNFAAIGKLL